MGVINRANVSKAIKDIIKAGTEGYLVVRNEKRNDDPSTAAAHKAWVGVYRSRVSYGKFSTGPSPWLATVETVVEIQVASMNSGENVEDRLQAAEKEIIDVIAANNNLNGTVSSIREISVEDESNVDTEVYYQAAVITIKAEART